MLNANAKKIGIANESQFITYPVVEMFHSLQGEGTWTGVNAFFIRLGGCNVHCPWCDTKQSWNAQRYPRFESEHLASAAKSKNPAIVVITGGEPLMHDLEPLTRAIHEMKMQVHLETSGAYPISGKFDWVTFSPKQFKPPHSSIYDRADELKVVILNDFDLKWAEQQAALVSPQTIKYLQPEWNTPQSKKLILNYILQHPEWRLSLQTHKFLEIR